MYGHRRTRPGLAGGGSYRDVADHESPRAGSRRRHVQRRPTAGGSHSSARSTTSSCRPVGTSRSAAGSVRSSRSSWHGSRARNSPRGLGDGPVTHGSHLCGVTGWCSTAQRAPFHDVCSNPRSAAVAAWLERVRPQRAQLDVGELSLEPGVRFLARCRRVRPAHVLLRPVGLGEDATRSAPCSSSSSSRRALRIVVLDPNSDFVRLSDGAGRALTKRSRPVTRSAAGGSWCVSASVGRRPSGSTSASPTAMQRSRRRFCGSTRFVTARSTARWSRCSKAASRAPTERRATSRERLLHASDDAGRGRSAPGFATSASIGGGLVELATRVAAGPRRAGWAARASSSTSARSRRRVRRRSRRRASSPHCGGAAPSASPCSS